MAEEDTPSHDPLGRYDSAGGADEPLHEVRLLGLPVQVFVAGREHHDEVMREFALMALDERVNKEQVPARLLELVEVLGRRYGASTQRPDSEMEAAIASGATVVDLGFHVPAHVVDAADQLESLLAEADEFCRDAQLLTLERSALVIEFSHWYLDEFRRQVRGEPPRSWPGALSP